MMLSHGFSFLASFLVLLSLHRCNASQDTSLLRGGAETISRALSGNTTACVQGTCAVGSTCIEGTCVDASAIQFCGPGDEIEFLQGGDLVRVRPTGILRKDHLNMKWAVDEVTSGGTVELCEGEFNLGTEWLQRKTVHIRQGLTLKGKYINGTWHTVIRGGGSLSALVPDRKVGSFKVGSDNDPNPVIFDGVWIRDWLSEGIYITGCNGITFTQSKMTHPVVSGFGFPLGLISYIHGIFALNQASRGKLLITNSEFDMSREEGKIPHDAQVLSLYGLPPTAFSYVGIENNKMKSYDDVIELLLNKPPDSSQFVIRNNEIDVSFDSKGIWPFHYVFFINENKKSEEILIEDNEVRVRNLSLRKVHDLGIFCLTGENFVVRSNRIESQGDFEGSIIRLGSVGSLVVYDFGRSVQDSLFEDNEVIGSYYGPGVVFTGGRTNKSRNNTFRLGESFAANAQGVTISNKQGRNVCGNTWEGNTGIVEGDINQSC